TVLEKHRRIYRRLVELEAPRWTPRERSDLINAVRTEIELLWLTGELRLEKPTVAQELAWGLYFVTENLFDVVPDLVDKLERARPGSASSSGRPSLARSTRAGPASTSPRATPARCSASTSRACCGAWTPRSRARSTARRPPPRMPRATARRTSSSPTCRRSSRASPM